MITKYKLFETIENSEIEYEILKMKNDNFLIKCKLTKNTLPVFKNLGEIRTTKSKIDIELNTISISDIRTNEYYRKEKIATRLYQKLLSILPKEIKGIRMSDVVISPFIEKIYQKLGSIKIDDQLIIPNNKLY